MPSHPDRSPYRWIAQGLMVLLLVLVAIPAYLALAPSWRTLAVRLGCAAIVMTVCVRLTRSVRDSIDEQPVSVLDAPRQPSAAPELDERFLRLRGDLIASTRSRQYFDAILWPRLLGIAGETLPRPPERRGLRKLGPSLGAIERLMAEAEKRR